MKPADATSHTYLTLPRETKECDVGPALGRELLDWEKGMGR